MVTTARRVSLVPKSLALLRSAGWTVDVAERWLPGVGVRKDLFGIIDLVALREDVTMGVQVTSLTNVSSHVHKINDSPHLVSLHKAGWVLSIHAWSKRNGRWQVKQIEIEGTR